MDSLLRALETFSVSQTKTESEFDEMLSRMETLQTHDPDAEWDTLTGNYSKIRYLDLMISNYDFPETKIFVDVLHSVLTDIDKKTEYYLSELNWDDDNKEEYEYIRDLFEKSLNENNPFDKIKMVLEAYDTFIPIIEDYRTERFVDHNIDNLVFVKEIKTMRKKRKLN